MSVSNTVVNINADSIFLSNSAQKNGGGLYALYDTTVDIMEQATSQTIQHSGMVVEVCMDGQHNSDQLALWKFSALQSVCGKSRLHITHLVPPSCWGHVPGTENPADSASRGLFPTELMEVSVIPSIASS